MLRYLDNAALDKDAPNENLRPRAPRAAHRRRRRRIHRARCARRARLLTGLSVEDDRRVPLPAARSTRPAPVRVLGFSHANSSTYGEMVVAYLDYLAHHPATARRLARKLAVRFVADDPPAGARRPARAIYLANDTASRRCCGSCSPRRRSSRPPTRRSAGRSRTVVATVRALGSGPAGIGTAGLQRPLLGAPASQGHQPYTWPQPDGYPDRAAAWTSSAGTLARWNTTSASRRAGGPRPSAPAAASPLVPRRRPATHGALVARAPGTAAAATAPSAHVAASALPRREHADPTRADSAGARLAAAVRGGAVLDSPTHLLR